jgi:hypothetical protein
MDRTDGTRHRDGHAADTEGPKIVRKDQVTQGTEMANLPHADDPIQEASEESFPASDPPAFSGRRDERLAGERGDEG